MLSPERIHFSMVHVCGTLVRLNITHVLHCTAKSISIHYVKWTSCNTEHFANCIASLSLSLITLDVFVQLKCLRQMKFTRIISSSPFKTISFSECKLKDSMPEPDHSLAQLNIKITLMLTDKNGKKEGKNCSHMF